MNTYADRLKQAMKLRVIDQSALARLVGVKQQSIQYLCREGKRSVHSVKIAEILKINANWLTDGIGEMEFSDDGLFIEKFKSLSLAQKKIFELMMDEIVQNPSHPIPAQLASRAEPSRAEPSRAEPQQKEPNQEQQSQDRRVMTRRKPSQFEIELAIEQERCVMERHAEAVIANERYVRL